MRAVNAGTRGRSVCAEHAPALPGLTVETDCTNRPKTKGILILSHSYLFSLSLHSGSVHIKALQVIQDRPLHEKNNMEISHMSPLIPVYKHIHGLW